MNTCIDILIYYNVLSPRLFKHRSSGEGQREKGREEWRERVRVNEI